MGTLDKISKEVSRAVDRTGAQLQRAKNKPVWGSNPYAQWAERVTGVTTFKRGANRLSDSAKYDNGDAWDGNMYKDAKGDFNVARPTKAYQDETVNEPARAIAEQQRATEEAFTRRQAAEEVRARGQIAARIRRSGQSDKYGNSSGTNKTGPSGLGSTGGYGQFASMLGLI